MVHKVLHEMCGCEQAVPAAHSSLCESERRGKGGFRSGDRSPKFPYYFPSMEGCSGNKCHYLMSYFLYFYYICKENGYQAMRTVVVLEVYVTSLLRWWRVSGQLRQEDPHIVQSLGHHWLFGPQVPLETLQQCTHQIILSVSALINCISYYDFRLQHFLDWYFLFFFISRIKTTKSPYIRFK